MLVEIVEEGYMVVSPIHEAQDKLGSGCLVAWDDKWIYLIPSWYKEEFPNEDFFEFIPHSNVLVVGGERIEGKEGFNTTLIGLKMLAIFKAPIMSNVVSNVEPCTIGTMAVYRFSLFDNLGLKQCICREVSNHVQ
jgi:hypothetical protein